jgi:hypothetical protein
MECGRITAYPKIDKQGEEMAKCERIPRQWWRNSYLRILIAHVANHVDENSTFPSTPYSSRWPVVTQYDTPVYRQPGVLQESATPTSPADSALCILVR